MGVVFVFIAVMALAAYKFVELTNRQKGLCGMAFMFFLGSAAIYIWKFPGLTKVWWIAIPLMAAVGWFYHDKIMPPFVGFFSLFSDRFKKNKDDEPK